MPQPRPSCTLVLDIDERLYSEDVKLEVQRCYAYVCATLVRTHPATEGEPVNTARMLAKLGTRHYLHSTDEGADELWNDVMERWIYNELHKIGNNMVIYNRRQREIGGTELFFDWVEVELENGALTLAWRTDSTSFIAPECALLASRARTLLNEGACGENVVRIQMPSDASYERQQQQAAEDRARIEAEKAAAAEAEAEAARQAAEEAEKAAEASFLESPALKAEEEAAEAEGETREELREEIEEKYALPEADFAVDYTLWTVVFEDGTERDFDSTAGAFAVEDETR